MIPIMKNFLGMIKEIHYHLKALLYLLWGLL